MQIRILMAVLLLMVAGCKKGNGDHDASGIFEADEVIISSEVSGKILQFEPDEGAVMKQGDSVVFIDATGFRLQKEQVEASIQTLPGKTTDVGLQVRLLEDQYKVQAVQLNHLEKERARFDKLVKADAATGKQLDDIVAQIDQLAQQMKVTQQQIRVQQNVSGTQNRAILSERSPLEKKVAQLDDQIQRTVVLQPVPGTILTKYAQKGEVTAPGKALYKMADLRVLRLRAYVSHNQLAGLRLGQQLKVQVDDGKGGFRSYEGKLSWISDKAEFTPKTIQTKDERANLVYAVKVDVVNDGFLKLGMYGELTFGE